MMRFILLAVLIGSAAHAESLEIDTPTSYSANVSNHTLFTSTKGLETDRSPQLLRSETHLRGELNRLSLGVIVANRFALETPDGYDLPLILEKKHVTYETDEWKFTAGDSHYEIGRGIALALFRDELLGIDNTVEGAALKYQPSGWEFNAVGGRVRRLQSPVALNPFPNNLANREIWIATTGVKRRWADTAIGANYLLTVNQDTLTSEFDKRWHTTGATIESNLGAVDVYAESNVMVGQDLLFDDEVPTGFGSYASVVYSPVPYKLQLEFKDYRNYAYDFMRPPTMEEDIVTALNFSNVTAAKFSAERRMGVYNAVRASLMSGEDRSYKSVLHHAVLSGKWKLGEVGFESRAGKRWMFNQQNLTHGDIKAKIPTFTGQTFELGYRKLHNITGLGNSLLTTLDDRNFFDFGYTFSSNWSVNFGVEYVPTNGADLGQTFVNAGAIVKVDAFTSRAFVGSTSGGPQCSGGICRNVPAYSGFLLEGTYAF